jgi:hypothetical protein
VIGEFDMIGPTTVYTVTGGRDAIGDFGDVLQGFLPSDPGQPATPAHFCFQEDHPGHGSQF